MQGAMTSTELKALEILWDWGGEASVGTIARELNISGDYAQVICEALGRDDYIDFLNGRLCRLRGRGKLEVAKRKSSSPQKVVIPEEPFESGRETSNKKRFVVAY